jgi:hypothetical protein
MHILQISTYGFDPRFPSRPEFVLARTLAEMGHRVDAIEYWHDQSQPQRVEFAPKIVRGKAVERRNVVSPLEFNIE